MKRIVVDLGDARRVITALVKKADAKYFADGFSGRPFVHRRRSASGIVKAYRAYDLGVNAKRMTDSGELELSENGLLLPRAWNFK